MHAGHLRIIILWSHNVTMSFCDLRGALPITQGELMRIGIDVGGTNTDAVLMDGRQVAGWAKSPTMSMKSAAPP